MSHEWDRGVLANSSWHGLEEIGMFTDADSMIAHGERCGAWPVDLETGVSLTTPEGLLASVTAIVARYASHPSRVVGVVGSRYRATTPEEFRGLIRAITEAGAKPTGAFSLRNGTRVLATFQVGEHDGKRTNLVIADSFDGSMRLMVGFTVIDVVCANTLAAAFAQDGESWAKIRHTASLEDKVAALTETIGEAVQRGTSVAELHERATKTVLKPAAARAAFDALFPPAAEDASQSAKTRAENLRQEARDACALEINKRGQAPGTVATLWNAATWLVDRKVSGESRKARGGDQLDSMLFGSRAKRIAEIQTKVEVLMADGSVQEMTVPEATEAGVDTQQIGSALLSSILEG